VGTGILSLLLGFLSLAWYDVSERRQEMIHDATILAKVVGQTTAEAIADEVNTLANRTGNPTHGIAHLIVAVQEGPAGAVEADGAGPAVVQRGVQRSNEAARDSRTATEEIAVTIERIRSVAKGVKHSSVEQRKKSQLTTRATTNVSDIINRIARSIHAQATSGHTIQRALEILHVAASRSAKRVLAMDEVSRRWASRRKARKPKSDSFRPTD
jgi:methyl-accepting chemotaxis protein